MPSPLHTPHPLITTVAFCTSTLSDIGSRIRSLLTRPWLISSTAVEDHGKQTGMTDEAPTLAAAGILALLLTLHVGLKVYARIAPKGEPTARERQLLTEIKELNRSAKELSTPATFAKSSKLKRQAAVKEKELAQLRQELSLRKGSRLPSSALFALALKVVVHVLLVLWFWRTSVATVPVALLRPYDFLVNMGTKAASGDLVEVGIIPWLVMSSRVCDFLSGKIVGKPLRKPTTSRFSFLKSSSHRPMIWFISAIGAE